MKQQQLLSSGLATIELTISQSLQQKLLSFLELLQQWNKVYNLTAIKDFESMIFKHLIDSLAIAKFLEKTQILDVGTGAGLPGIPLALIFPEKNFVLIDSNQKKVAFVQQAIATLRLKNTTIVHTRVENYHPSTKFDVIISRAYADLKTFVSSCSHLCCEDGFFLAMKGKAEIVAIETLPTGYIISKIEGLIVPEVGERCAVFINNLK